MSEAKRPTHKPQGRHKPDGQAAPASTADHTCPVAGVGASAGGLEAFSRLLRALPERIGMALVLVQHLDPTQVSMLADILSRQSMMPVAEAEDGTSLKADHVYVMPAGVTMTVRSGTIKLAKRPKSHAKVLPIDTFLRSLADSCGSRAVGIVLSGTGSDGLLGLGAIKEAGGLTFAQDPETAEYPGMPQAAINAGVVDSVLDPERLAAELVRIGAHPDLVRPGQPDSDVRADVVDEEALRRIITLVREATGLDLSQYRRTTLLRRIARRMLLEGIPTIDEYLGRLQDQSSNIETLYRDVLVNMTEFFRDPDALEALSRTVFPELLERKAPEDPFRIWIPGCSKGQEAYSILMTLVEFFDDKPSSPEIQMFATDVNEHDVEFARAGVYPQGISNEISEERLARFFVQVPGGYQIERSIREMCVIAVHDVTKDPPFSKLDLVSFRNVLIYMERPLQQRVLQILHYALAPGGFLLLGSSETPGPESPLFSVVDKKQRIYKRKPGPGKLIAALATHERDAGFARRSRGPERTGMFDVLAAAEKVVQGGYQPTGVLITSDLDVLQFRGHVGPYLDPTEGAPEFKLPRLIAPGLSPTVEAAIREAAKTKASASKRGTIQPPDGDLREVDVEAVPIASPLGDLYYLVLFKDRSEHGVRANRGSKRGGATGTTEPEPELRRELHEAREQLQALVSEREATNSDLRAAGERFQSSNEELRTINEEFQTAQEELQSTNEELTTLNDELRNRNTELGHLTDDLNNVIEGVEIPILILDADLKISRFTPQTQAIANIVPTDVGRPITDLNLKVDSVDFEARIREVLQSGEPSQIEVRRTDGRWYSMRIRPYRTTEGTIDGAVIAFIDIDELKTATETTDIARQHAEAIVSTVQEPLLTLSADMRVREANDAFFRTFSVSPEETLGRSIVDLGDGQWDFPELQTLLGRVLPSDRGFDHLVVDRDFPRIGKRVMELYARHILEERGEPSILLAVHDITEFTVRERLAKALNDVSVDILSTLEFNDILERVLKQSSAALGADSAAVLVLVDGTWVMKNAYGLPRLVAEQAFDSTRLPEQVAALGAADPVILGLAEAAGFISELGLEPGAASVLAVPMLARGEKIGFVSFHYGAVGLRFSDVEMDFVRRLGALMSLAFENATLFATEKKIAQTLQTALLAVPKKIPGIRFGYLYRSATTAAAVGGDFFDLFELDGEHAGILLGDVSGKGVQAATLTALVRNTIRALAYENESPAVIMKKANSVIFRSTPKSMFVTIMLCRLDVKSGRLAYCSAGHTRGLVKRHAGAIEFLDVGSPLVGGFAEAEFTTGETTLEPDDALILYTNGVTEARAKGKLYGEKRLVKFVQKMEPMPPRKIPHAIFDEIQQYAGGVLDDDVAIVAVTTEKRD